MIKILVKKCYINQHTVLPPLIKHKIFLLLEYNFKKTVKDDKINNTITNIIHPTEELNDYLKQHENNIVFLLKIEEFQYLQDSFTHKITKKLQEIFLKELLKYMPKECKFLQVYLLNHGEFAFVKTYNECINEEDITHILQTFQQRVNKEKIKIGIVDYTLSIVASLAYGKDALQNAQIGLKHILKTKEEFVFSNNFLEKTIKESTKKLNQFIMLKEAIDSYNIISYFQPIINNQTLKIEKYESLVRLIDKDNNIVSPYHFLDIAKEGKYYHEITSIVLRNSFRALFNTNVNISLNLSALDLENQKTRDDFFVLLEKYKTETHRITVELVEDERIYNRKSVQKFIQEIKSKGVKISIDDFGRGRSNFTRIQDYNPDYIKIDGSLIRNIEHDKFSKDLVETIVFFAKKQNIKTIAEFVSNENIFNIIKDLGVDYSQGHYFAKAAVLDEVISSAL